MECQSTKTSVEECTAIQTRCETQLKAWWDCMVTACKTSDSAYCEKVH